MKSPCRSFVVFLVIGLLPAGTRLSHAGSASWAAHPVSADWNTATNWSPQVVPNGPADVATFARTSRREVTIQDSIEVAQVDFPREATTFRIHGSLPYPLTISGTGITNESRYTQTFVLDQQQQTPNGVALSFTNNATAGDNTYFAVMGGQDYLYGVGGNVYFYDTSTADHGVFELFGTSRFAFQAAAIVFNGTSTAADAAFTLHSSQGRSANITFYDESTAARATIENEGGDIIFHESSTAARSRITNHLSLKFYLSATADQAMIVNTGARFAGDRLHGSTSFYNTSTAANATITSSGGVGQNASAGALTFSDTATAANSYLIAEGGNDGGLGAKISFSGQSVGETARVELHGNATLDVSLHVALPAPGIGSLEGEGTVTLGPNNLAVGSNNRSTSFAGSIQDTGSLTKRGAGTLTLSGANTYAGGTTVAQGVLLVTNSTGSATGSGPVHVNGRMLAGTGILAGDTTIGSGFGAPAFLEPSAGRQTPATLTIQAWLTMNANGVLRYLIDTVTAASDQVVANGATLTGGTQLQVYVLGNNSLTTGRTFVVINNTAATPISGTFDNLPDGGTINIGSNTFQANYEGGDGNDLTLTVVQ